MFALSSSVGGDALATRFAKRIFKGSEKSGVNVILKNYVFLVKSILFEDKMCYNKTKKAILRGGEYGQTERKGKAAVCGQAV